MRQLEPDGACKSPNLLDEIFGPDLDEEDSILVRSGDNIMVNPTQTLSQPHMDHIPVIHDSDRSRSREPEPSGVVEGRTKRDGDRGTKKQKDDERETENQTETGDERGSENLMKGTLEGSPHKTSDKNEGCDLTAVETVNIEQTEDSVAGDEAADDTIVGQSAKKQKQPGPDLSGLEHEPPEVDLNGSEPAPPAGVHLNGLEQEPPEVDPNAPDLEGLITPEGDEQEVARDEEVVDGSDEEGPSSNKIFRRVKNPVRFQKSFTKRLTRQKSKPDGKSEHAIVVQNLPSDVDSSVDVELVRTENVQIGRVLPNFAPPIKVNKRMRVRSDERRLSSGLEQVLSRSPAAACCPDVNSATGLNARSVYIFILDFT